MGIRKEATAVEKPALDEEFRLGDYDPDLAEVNDPDVENLGEAPMLGGGSHISDLFGESASYTGRPSSPKLWAQATQFPTATQFRVWRIENGIPSALGAIDVNASEEDFVREFYSAMPKPGDGRFQFTLRPVTVRGEPLGKEITQTISEHHVVLKQMRERERREKEEQVQGNPSWGPAGGWGPNVITVPGGDSSGSYYAEEMGRMFESVADMKDQQTQVLQEQLERERAELRELERQRAEERIRTAERSSSVVEKVTEKLMETERVRANETIAAQKENGQLVLSTLTTVFSQQQEAARQAAERQRQMDMERAALDREFFARQQQETERRLERERAEAEESRRREREEWDRRLERERVEAERKAAAERAEMELKRQMMAEERERWRAELEHRRQAEQLEWERKMTLAREEREQRERLEREERERRERAERERWEREKLETQRRIEQERLEWEKRQAEERRAAEAREQARREEVLLQQKQMEMAAERDRQHAERMMEMARMERESQREAQLSREKAEREAREAAERERQRQHDMALREMEMAKERDREHQERLLQLQKAQHSGGLSNLTDMLGMDTPDLLARIFGGGGGESESSWADAIPKALAGIAELGKVMVAAQGAKEAAPPRRDPDGQRMVAVQTPAGVRMIPASVAAELEAEQLRQMRQDARVAAAMPHPVADAQPTSFASSAAAEEGASEEDLTPRPQETRQETDAYREAQRVNTLKRANEAKIPLQDQKAARRALRELVKKAGKQPEDQWPELVLAAAMSTPSILPYLQAVTVYAALAEAKAPADLAERIVAALKASEDLPAGLLPFTEADLNKQKESAEAEVEAEDKTDAPQEKE